MWPRAGASPIQTGLVDIWGKHANTPPVSGFFTPPVLYITPSLTHTRTQTCLLPPQKVSRKSSEKVLSSLFPVGHVLKSSQQLEIFPIHPECPLPVEPRSLGMIAVYKPRIPPIQVTHFPLTDTIAKSSQYRHSTLKTTPPIIRPSTLILPNLLASFSTCRSRLTSES